MERYNGQAIVKFDGDDGNAAVGVIVTVIDNSTGGAATLYATNSTGGATLTNPLPPTDSDGRYYFYAPDGNYTLSFSSGDPDIVISLFDSNELESYMKYAREDTPAITLAGIIRQTTQSGGWTYIDDANHRPAGFQDPITVDGLEVVIPYSKTTPKIGAISVTPDESFAHKITVGASVGTSEIRLKFYADLNVLVNNESATVPASGTNPVTFGLNQYQNPAFVTVTKDTDGAILVDHPNTAADGNIYEPRQVQGALKTYQTINSIVTQNAGAVKYAQYIPLSGIVQYDGISSFDIFTETLNKPTAVWNATTEKLDVTHETVDTTFHGLVLTPREVAQILSVDSVTSTGFSVEFYDPVTGAKLTSPASSMRFYFSVESNFVQSENARGRTLVNCGRVQLDPNYVFLSNGNFWITGAVED